MFKEFPMAGGGEQIESDPGIARRSRGLRGYVVKPKGSAGRRGLSKPGGSQAACPRPERM